MSYSMDYVDRRIAAEAAADARAAFIRRTYAHLAAAILAFVGLETLLVKAVPFETIAPLLTGRFSWFIVILLFMGVGHLAYRWAMSGASPIVQYAGLALYVVAEAIIFFPLIQIATLVAGPDIISKAGILTLTLFGGLTLGVFVTRNDFSFLGSILSVGGCVAMGLIVVSVVMGFDLGLLFCAGMVVLACGSILYQTSNVLHHFRTDQHVAASLALFASVALLLWYIIQVLMYLSDRR